VRNRRISVRSWVLIFASACAASVAHAGDDETYAPPSRGAPRSTLSNGVSPGPAPPRITLIALDSVFETPESQPTLFWHIDSLPANRAELEFFLVSPSSAAPIVATRLPAPRVAGLQTLSLAAYDASLEPEQLYEWSISLRLDPSSEEVGRRKTGFVRYRPLESEFSASARTGAYASFDELHRALLVARDAVALAGMVPLLGDAPLPTTAAQHPGQLDFALPARHVDP
jgi:hypothetical protein